jgi:hypothetical protein
MRLPPAIVALALAAAIAGCGGDDGADDADEVRQVTRDYLTALAAGNGRRACEQLTEQARREAIETVTAAFLDAEDVTCEEAIAELSADIAEDRKRALLNPEISDVEIEGDRAEVRVKSVNGSTTLSRVGDAWRVVRSDTS